MSRIGVFGGTFDPVHHGHLIMAQEAVARLGLDRMLFVAAGRPYHKRAPDLADVKHRVAMLRLATRGNPVFEVSRLEADQAGPTYTVVTLETLRRTIRGELYFLMGQDSLEEFARWRMPERILKLARLVVVPRGEGDLASLPAAIRRRVVYVKPPRIGISSSEIRRRLKRGLPVRYWTPDLVLSYVTRHGLYGTRKRRR
ncbi:MAG: nicotinate-nucleotide adenylyltransferase [Candidatus Eisenbacteria bacterium]|uniref:Probable nicotinate-nucleotide adenylyltransferase n=1 Tax=Eiseniibacteriota bacterium TaxID=2212470 RepID=A0A538T797_UNCEI|nr:MAG: nicotinate-nucleotide adenylyltransferase [Candidatus Eisenbacteria bacterium]